MAIPNGNPDTTGDSNLHMIKFGARWCPPCKGMKKAKTLEKFAALHPDLVIEDIDVDEAEEDDSLPDPDDYGCQSIPFFVVVEAGEDEENDDDDGEENDDDDDDDGAPDVLASLVGAVTIEELEKLLDEAKRELRKRG